MIRHGKTENNKLGLFTGWDDVPLAADGVEEAKEAGKLLKLHGFEFDAVYTSWLSRAIETAWYVLDELDCLWLPIIKSWRLNERMYGDLTGLSKAMVKQRHGEKQFKAWRRGYAVNPPPVSSFSPQYPGNDPRYNKYLKDVRFSGKSAIVSLYHMISCVRYEDSAIWIFHLAFISHYLTPLRISCTNRSYHHLSSIFVNRETRIFQCLRHSFGGLRVKSSLFIGSCQNQSH